MAVEKKAYKLTTKLALEIIARRQIRPDAPNTQPGDVGNGHVLVIDETHQKFNGIIYKRVVHTKTQSVVYKCVRGNKRYMLHKEVWMFHNGAVPVGYAVHHEHRRLDGTFDKDENNIEYLFLMTSAEHMSYHMFAGPYVKKICQNPKCGKAFWTLMKGKKKKFCCADCRQASQNENLMVENKIIDPEVMEHLEYAIEHEDHSFADAGQSKHHQRMETRVCFYCNRPFQTHADSTVIACSRLDCKGRNLIRMMARRQSVINKRIAERKNPLQTFFNEEFGKLDVVVIDGEAWFIGKQVATMLGYKNPAVAISENIDISDKKLLTWAQMQSSGLTNFASPRGLMLINEFGLNELILDSKLPAAKRIRHWITHEVMPSLRRRGTYSFTEHPPTAADYLSEEEMQALIAFREFSGNNTHALTKLNGLKSEQKQLLVQLIDQFDRDNQPTMIDVTPAEG